MSIWAKIWWLAVGAWLIAMAGLFVEASREQGGAMPAAPVLLVLFGVGGLLFFLVTHIVVRKIDANSKEEDE